LDFGKFVINLNNRKIVNGLLEYLNIADKKQDVMRMLDKYYKVGEKVVVDTLIEDYNIDAKVVETLINFVKIQGSTDQIIISLKNFGVDNQTYNLGVEEIEQVVKFIRMQGVPDEYFAINLTIVRGLDYYTGTVYETMLTDYPSLGSVCSGGRYDNLAEYYTQAKLPGVGISIGLTRLFYQLCENNLIKTNRTSIAKALVLPMDDNAIEKAYKVASMLRANNIACQVYLEDKKFKNKMNYADKLKIPYCVIIGQDEVDNGYVTIKNMFESTQEKVEDSKIVAKIK